MAIRYAKETCITNAKNVDVKKFIKMNAREPYDGKALVMLLCGFGTSFFVCPMVAYHEELQSAVYIVMAAIPGIFIYLGLFLFL